MIIIEWSESMSNKPLDKINEAYKGEMGKEFSEKTRSRINWIVNQVNGNKILDIGCSQGIVPIILGREGKKVDAIDIAVESIEYAKKELAGEHASVQENVNFIVANFMTETNLLEGNYDTILLTEVLEHISDTKSFLWKINRYLDKDGVLVVTVPFGINDYFDHKRTYYFLELHSQLSELFSIKNIKYLGKWVGCICNKKEEISRKTNKEFSEIELIRLEKAFYTIERDYITKINNLKTFIDERNSQYDSIRQSLREQYSIVENYKKEIEILTEKIVEYKKIILEKGKDQTLLEMELAENKNILIKERERILNKEKEVKELYEKNYKLMNSKFGKLASTYWKIRRKISGR